MHDDRPAEAYEAEYVHEVYEKIAAHFSSTRYKPWPIVERFLLSLPPGSIGLDVGCGNGKYLPINRDIFIVASDRSTNLAQIARATGGPHDAVVADVLALPHPQGTFDFAISIAVIHHLSTAERRVEAVRVILNTLKTPVGKALIYVWALEQKDSRRGWDATHEQDVMVPWVLQNRGNRRSKKKGSDVKVSRTGASAEDTGNEVGATTNRSSRRADGEAAVEAEEKAVPMVVYNRYYHLYRKGELESDIQLAGGRVLESGYEKDNWWAVAAPCDMTSAVPEV